jgi:hypothetical protein
VAEYSLRERREAGTVDAAPALVNAVSDALTPLKIWSLLQAGRPA